MTEAEGIALYLAVRDRRAQRKKAYQVDDEKDKMVQDKLEANFLAKFQKNGTDSLTVRGVGTAYTSTKTSASVADHEIFMQFIKDNDEWGLLDARALKSAIEVYKEQHQALPPGINWSEEIVVNVRKA
jgi:hypothetical protein